MAEQPGSVSGLRVRLAVELWFFAAPRNRRDQVIVGYDGTATLGHVVQSLGVPMTEVGSLLLDDVPASSAHRPSPGSIVEIEPVHPPQEYRERFVLDVHLGTLARRLRLLGVDAAYSNDAADDELLAQAGGQCRVLLTRDRGLLCRRALVAGAFVYHSKPFEQLIQVLRRFRPTLRPWTRCISCNGLLDPADKADVLEELEPGTRQCYDVFARCGSCGQVYWRGAHAAKLDGIIESARDAASM